MQYIKISTDSPFSDNWNKVGSNDAYLYVKKNSNNEPELCLYCNKDGSSTGSTDYTFTSNSKLVNISNESLATSIACDCSNGTIFNIENPIQASQCNIVISNFNKVPGKGVLIKCNIGSNVTIKYRSTAYFNTNTGSDYTAGTYYIQFLYLSGNTDADLKLINFFKEPLS